MLCHFKQMTVKTEQQPNGEFTAIEADNYPGPMGWGGTPLEAIADLAEQLRECGELAED